MVWEQIIANWANWRVIYDIAYAYLMDQETIGPALAGALDVLSQLMVAILYLAFYPIIWLIYIIQSLIFEILMPLINLINAVVNAGISIYDTIYLFQGVFPTPWIVGLTAILSIVIGLRIYSLIPVFGRK